MVSVHRSQRTGRVSCATSLVIASAAEVTGCPSALDSSFAVGSPVATSLGGGGVAVDAPRP